ncbi:putative amidohydrolase [Erwinia toletana]|uniref:Amidohydrolase n=1 Tax=Winslowiella toletana TaxID=92490 RepID=A0ABS4P2Z2_9GAMM|nr:carbon-nitrogen hydrolase family protein [Winslowiella toletana]MBP2167029.1 putative amidohydrolase [Winslowiella toletana]
MPLWSVAAAQYASRARDIDANISHHLRWIEHAAAQGVDLLLFPELSLTGYELEAAPELAMSPNDPRLELLASAARNHHMTVIVGLPLRMDHAQHIAAMSFLPDGTRLSYAKRQLHGSEQAFFAPGHGGPLFGVPTRNVALAVCADIAVEQFAREAAEGGADLYAAGALLSEQSYDNDCQLLARWATAYNMSVLLANHATPGGGYQCNGGSAFWDANGKQVIRAGDGELLMIARRNAGGWQAEVHPLG